ncbi:MAG: peptide chain release factor 2 [Clostridia bacterium]|nr:peptide chain release factor 2 [Clostridia bacterium]
MILELEDNNHVLNSLKQKLTEIGESLDISNLEKELSELEEKTLQNGFWDDSKKSSIVLQKIKTIKNKIERFKKLNIELNNLIEMSELIMLENESNDVASTSNLNSHESEQDNSLVKDILDGTKTLQTELDNLEVETLLSGKYDINNAIVTIHPGAGGTESQDWAEMLYRMYTRWANANNFAVQELDYLDGDEAGLKSVTFLISGDYAYGYMKSEKGVHRLVRISPFDSGGRRHTSFASVEVLPEITEDIEIDINPDDLRIDTYRASGAGGQHINKTSSAIRITHIPTNIVVACQTERSQIQNKETAMKMLKSKLLDLKEREHKEKIEDLKGEQKDIAWGSQIRSYVFCPYTLVKDHRTNFETGNVQSVMDGDLNGFMKEYLKNNREEV